MKAAWIGVGVALLLLARGSRQGEESSPAAEEISRTELVMTETRPVAPRRSHPEGPKAHLVISVDDFTGKLSPFWQSPGAGRIALTLPNGRSVVAIVDRTEWRGPERFVSRGRFDGQAGSVALFTYARGEVSGYFNAPELGEFQMSGSTRAGFATIVATGGLDCAGAIAAPPRIRPAAAREHAEFFYPAGAKKAAEVMAQAVTIDVLGLYLQDSFGPNTTEDIARSNFDLNIELCNTIYANSQIPLRLRLVRVAQTSYRETNTTDQIRMIGDALESLRSRNDGQMDEIHALRDETGADLVFLAMSRFAPGAGGPSGMSYIQFFPSVRSPRDWAANPEFGFCVVKARSDNNFSALPHEIGHNFGCAHDRPNAGMNGGAFPYSFGYRFTAQNGQRYRTIMSYGNEHSALVFSNPRVTLPAYGVPAGVEEGFPGEADNAQTVARAMFEIAAFRLSADAPGHNRVINVATRAWAGVGAEALIGGFTVVGGGPMPVVVRALGPSLGEFGVDGAMMDPVIELRRQSDGALVRRNDNWSAGDAESLAGLATSGLAPGAAWEPAVFMMLPPGGYSAVVSAADGRAGNGIVEVFGVGGSENSGRLGNLSTRAFVGGDGREMIGGFVVNGAPGETKRIVIRALGPSLQDHGVSGALDDPLIELHDSGGALLLIQDDFSASMSPGVAMVRSTYAQDKVFAAGLQPGNRREPCVMLDLVAGAYSVVVRPADRARSGVALLEVFEIAPPQ